MRNYFLSLLFALLFGFSVFPQDYLNATTISEELLKGANSVVRLNHKDISLMAPDKMNVVVKRVITVLNKKGNTNIDAYIYYDSNKKIKVLEADIFDKFGRKIKTFKKSDFKDNSAVDGVTLYSDSRVKYLDYTPVAYPYTIAFNLEYTTDNTAFILPFFPIDNYNTSIEQSSYRIENTAGLKWRKKEKNFDNFNIIRHISDTEMEYVIQNFRAIKKEDYSPALFEYTPHVLFAVNNFNIVDVSADVENWKDFGQWVYDKLLQGTNDLPAATVNEVKALVKDEQDEFEKAKRVYEYVQGKTRYISVQIGIGGWKPFKASEVDRLGYGDCKGLTNYTMSLLDAVGVEANYTLVYAGDNQRSIDKDFASMQGNHVILSIPRQKDTVWLECTSQEIPFGFLGNFTDDRDVLVVTPEGGKIQHTKKYTIDENTQSIVGSCKIDTAGTLFVQSEIISRGLQYNDKYMLDSEPKEELQKHYKKRWRFINNITLDSVNLQNNKDLISMTEEVAFKATEYTSINNDRMLLTVNILNRLTKIPSRYRDRKLPLKIKRSFKDSDSVSLTLPKGYEMEAQLAPIAFETKFGNYAVQLKKMDDGTLLYTRKFAVRKGTFDREEYKNFRAFYKKVARYDNLKIALIKKE